MIRATALVVLALAASATATSAQPPTMQPRVDDRVITPLGGDVYDVRVGARHTVFAANTAGILLVDPLSVPVAQWLQGEFAKRFPGVAVRYVVLTHHHADRAAGASVFAKTAAVMAQAEFAAALRDSRESGADAFRFVANPRTTFTGQHTITLGTTRVDLVSIGPFDSPDQTAVVFPATRTAFVTHPPPVMAAPFNFGRLKTRDVVSWFAAVSRLDADRILFDDGTVVMRNDLAVLSDYFSTMRRDVLRAFERGRSLAEIQSALLLTPHKNSPHYAGRAAQIEAMYRQVEMVRFEIVAAGQASYLPQDTPHYCDAFTTCSSGGVLPFATVGGLISVGRRFGLQGEFSGGQQYWGARSRSLHDEETVLRLSRISILLKANLTQSRSVAVLAGLSKFTGDVKGMDRVQGTFPPVAGRHPLSANDQRNALTVGFELSPRIGPVRFVLPLRFSRTFEAVPTYWPHSTNASAGLGVSFPIFRRLK